MISEQSSGTRPLINITKIGISRAYSLTLPTSMIKRVNFFTENFLLFRILKFRSFVFLQQFHFQFQSFQNTHTMSLRKGFWCHDLRPNLIDKFSVRLFSSTWLPALDFSYHEKRCIAPPKMMNFLNSTCSGQQFSWSPPFGLK